MKMGREGEARFFFCSRRSKNPTDTCLVDTTPFLLSQDTGSDGYTPTVNHFFLCERLTHDERGAEQEPQRVHVRAERSELVRHGRRSGDRRRHIRSQQTDLHLQCLDDLLQLRQIRCRHLAFSLTKGLLRCQAPGRV